MKRNRSGIFAEISVICKRSYIVVVFLFLGTILLNSITAFALNEDYLDESKWSDNNNVTSEVLNKKSAGNILNGIFKYYIDNNNGSIYLYFSVTESSLNADNADVRISINAKSETESYAFSIDKNGMCDALNEEPKLFSVQQNFRYYSDTDSGLYIAGVQSDNSEQLTFEIRLYINGHVYRIADNIVTKPAEKTTTVKSSKTTTAKSNKTDKTGNSTATSGKSSTVAATTKFSGTPASTKPTTQTETEAYENSIEEAAGYSETVNEAAEDTSEPKIILSETAKICLGIGAAVCVIGLAFLILSVIAAAKEKRNTEE